MSYRVEDKMRLSKDKTTLVVNETLSLGDIPPEASQYRLGNRSALEWVIDQYQVSEDPRSGIRSENFVAAKNAARQETNHQLAFFVLCGNPEGRRLGTRRPPARAVVARDVLIRPRRGIRCHCHMRAMRGVQ